MLAGLLVINPYNDFSVDALLSVETPIH